MDVILMRRYQVWRGKTLLDCFYSDDSEYAAMVRTIRHNRGRDINIVPTGANTKWPRRGGALTKLWKNRPDFVATLRADWIDADKHPAIKSIIQLMDSLASGEKT